ncbi:MAG: type VI secretion system baseplate subunit TssG [Bacteroidetes bacterium]|nr:type VI secretion system baseplate subunit TssG [Bacteroidota bacterium]MBS1629566.1 type VI secretion system baseplate subunit TssG [Bacteroidota bacterium]
MNPELEHIRRREVVADLEAAGADFKACVLAAELVDRGMPLDAIFFRNESTFRRAVAKDVARISWNLDGATDDNDLLIFDLNREGIYDMLPEAMVHTQSRKHKTDEGAYKHGRELRRQEREARKFFSPLENEFHHRSLRLDLTEREILKNSNPRRNREFFNYFFEEASALSDQQLLVLLYILPLSHKIRGDETLIGLCVSRILGCTARVERQWKQQKFSAATESVKKLGTALLGADSVLGDTLEQALQTYELHIDQLSEQEYKNFSGNGKHLKVLHFILPYFFPANALYSICLNPRHTDAGLKTASAEANSYLGFNSYI